MQGHRTRGLEADRPRWLRETGVPAELRHRLNRWVEVDELTVEGFWTWLRLVLPVLLDLASASPRRRSTLSFLEQSHHFHQRVVVERREFRRLDIFRQQFLRDRSALERRLDAIAQRLEALEVSHPAQGPRPATPGPESAGGGAPATRDEARRARRLSSRDRRRYGGKGGRGSKRRVSP